MSKVKIENLISELNTVFGDGEQSEAQAKLLQDLENHVHDASESAPIEPTLIESIEMGLEELEEDHPNVAAILRESLRTLKNIGV